MDVLALVLSLIILVTLGTLLLWHVQGQTQPQFQFDVVVAQDGTGNYTTITEAVQEAPNNILKRFYIKIRAATYVERVYIGKEKTNLVFVGDGMDSTTITYKQSHATGWGTIDTATVAIYGPGFSAKHLTFRNSAGPLNQQAVALMSLSSNSAFYNCGFEGYQDTLFANIGVQFYRECRIQGSVDFIFGNAKAMFQNCDIEVHDPGMGHTSAVITAEGLEWSSEETAMSFHNCSISAAPDFPKSGKRIYLGRPWKPFSTVVIMQSYLGDLIDPKGWMPWSDKDNSALETLYYGEYQNHGPGATTVQRVNWRGYRILNTSEAEKFTVRRLIEGETWIPSTNIPFFPDLL